jgi:DNA-binding transcriptional MerR regulator
MELQKIIEVLKDCKGYSIDETKQAMEEAAERLAAVDEFVKKLSAKDAR